MPQSEAQRKAKQKYDAKNYKTIGIKCPIEEYNIIGKAANDNNQTASMFSRNCIKYCLDNKINFSENNNVSKQLYDLRIEHKMTPKQVVQRLEIPREDYMNYELGAEKPPSIVLSRICKLYNLSQNYFDTISDLDAVGNKGRIIQNSDDSETLTVSDNEFQAVKEFLKEYRKR